jgi:hypothetical protein
MMKHYATSWKVADSEVVGFFLNLPNLSSCTMALGLIYPPTEMSTGNLPGGKVLPAGAKADNLTAICELIV